MPTYITLANLTEKGAQNIDELPERFEEVEAGKRAMGGELKGLYLTFGQYDLVGISEMPDDETTAKFQLGAAMEGFIETETLRAFTVDEAEDILADLAD